AVPRVSVLLPVLDAPDTLARAASCILTQTERDLELLVILNGSGPETRNVAASLSSSDDRVRLLHLSSANLASALNAGLHAAASGLIARMDADDECTPDRLEVQLEHLAEHPTAAGAACDWEVRAPDGSLMAINRPPRSPDEGAWRLLVENPYPHGGMVLRAGRVLEAGGYDARLARAQDFDLWLRLREHGGIVTAPRTLYTHRLRATDSYSSSEEQAKAAAALLVKAWSVLPQGDRAEISALLGAAMFAGDGGQTAMRAIESSLTERGATREGVLAYLWAQRHLPPMSRRSADIARRSHARAKIAELPDRNFWLYGAGSHTRWLLDALPECRDRVLGVVDDAAQWQTVGGFLVTDPSSLEPGAQVLLSSDAAEDALWERSAALRARGVRVHRLYAEQRTAP
ncbi:MAG: glycosyltransferase family 2 protein, partial [Phycisphaerales bacterium]